MRTMLPQPNPGPRRRSSKSQLSRNPYTAPTWRRRKHTVTTLSSTVNTTHREVDSSFSFILQQKHMKVFHKPSVQVKCLCLHVACITLVYFLFYFEGLLCGFLPSFRLPPALISVWLLSFLLIFSFGSFSLLFHPLCGPLSKNNQTAAALVCHKSGGNVTVCSQCEVSVTD